jgi:glucosamine-6-phosphate deaminase
MIFDDPWTASCAVAGEIAALIRERAARSRGVVLGLATGSTPILVYAELARLHRKEGLSFRHVVTFNLDEYYPLAADEPQSYHRFMREHLFDHVDMDPSRIHIPDGSIPRGEVAAYCEWYERRIAEAGGIDLQLLGIGRTGHIGFNEPGSGRRSVTRLVELDEVTRRDAGKSFSGEARVPLEAITTGVTTILQARRIVLMAFGEHKAAVVARTVEGGVSDDVPATYLQEHGNCLMVLDKPAASGLRRMQGDWRD